jgi:xanthine dehydrogenase accessory factor
VDDRADWNTPDRFPRARRLLSWDDGVAAATQRPEATLACVMTCSHDTDFELLRKLLVRPPAFVGLIGSRSKRVCLFGRLIASGLDEAVVQRVHCPIGVGDTGKAPPLVAISMAAQILLESKKLAPL